MLTHARALLQEMTGPDESQYREPVATGSQHSKWREVARGNPVATAPGTRFTPAEDLDLTTRLVENLPFLHAEAVEIAAELKT